MSRDPPRAYDAPHEHFATDAMKEAFVQTFQNLRANKLRTILTMLTPSRPCLHEREGSPRP